jgi:hypothetical protein
MSKYQEARKQAIHDIRIALKDEGKTFISITVKQLIILRTYE